MDRVTLPRWAVLSWMISFASVTGDEPVAQRYVGELLAWASLRRKVKPS